MTVKSVCVYCGSSNHVDGPYKEAAIQIGTTLAQEGFRIIYGGGRVGLMGLVADSALKAGGHVTGIIPEHIQAHEVQHTGLNELIVVDSMHTRKSLMAEKADAFIVLPGGFGTLEEAFEILTWKQLGLHNKPIVIYNLNNFWSPLLVLIDHLIVNKFAPDSNYKIFNAVSTPDALLAVLKIPVGKGLNPEDKWN